MLDSAQNLLQNGDYISHHTWCTTLWNRHVSKLV